MAESSMLGIEGMLDKVESLVDVDKLKEEAEKELMKQAGKIEIGGMNAADIKKKAEEAKAKAEEI